MKEDQDQYQEAATGEKRKLEDSSISILLAKQKAQEIAARLVSDAESKRPRLEEEQPYRQPSPVYNPPPYPVFTPQSGQSYGSPSTSKKITIPNGKVGVIIGKQGETIKSLQLQSGAKIQITRDSEADPTSLTRDVDLTGTPEQISRAEQLISDVLAEADAGVSAPSTNQGFNSMQPGSEQFIMKVPTNKVALIIGKGGETIRTMQSKSGARIQVVPLHPPPGDMSTERSVHINGTTEQIEAAKELVNEVISGKRIVNPSGTNSYMQQSYPPPGSWAPPGQAPIQQQQPHYGYAQPGSYAPPASYYGNYPTQVAGWDHSNQVATSQPPQDSSGYNYYGQPPQLGSAPQNPNYNYNQTPPVAIHGYDQGYAQQPASYGGQAPVSDYQQQYATTGYGPPAVPSSADATASQSTQPSAAYPVPYSQPTANPQAGYWTHPSSTGQAHPGYYQTGYGGQQGVEDPSAASQPAAYGHGEYHQPEPSHYAPAVNPPTNSESQQQQQDHLQLPSNGYEEPSGYGGERTGDKNSDGDASAPATETVGSES
ncbi:hypothetical protein ACFX12_034697 [Malus domestica]